MADGPSGGTSGGRPGRGRGDRGSGSVLAVGAIAATLSGTLGGLAVASAVLAAHSARAAADLAALATAVQHQQGTGAPCAEARRVAAAQQAEVTACQVTADGTAQVTTSVPVALRLPGVGPTRATGVSRAGPEPG
ncbi:hypothetical protein GCM10027055_09560 [Janibacter alkaliphilus]|uniref:Secretion/DNA translocation related TadE-like protein n=1 Tax=Janibacter alkaliphilus TaxID=1069963 RepID=A0A852WYR2_9MICO|nr:Rv3654c family TadE-like protein [Janibacter alkaliphilus]NYG35976.1 secretion/DNA translocation related TadE-like protein [Janibacter alkaliphilus]